MKIYIGFLRTDSWISKLILKFTGGKWSHAFLCYYSAEFETWLQLGSEINGWVHEPVIGLASPHLFYLLPTPFDLGLGLKKNVKWLGTGYDFGGLLGMAWVLIAWRWLKRQIKNPLQSDASWFCSEIVAQIMRDSGATLTLEPGSTDPNRLELEVQALGGLTSADPWVS
jgi:hypothetical protein